MEVFILSTCLKDKLPSSPTMQITVEIFMFGVNLKIFIGLLNNTESQC